MKLNYTIFTFLLTVSSSFTFAEQDTVPVQVTQVCASCHGENGNMSILLTLLKLVVKKWITLFILKSYQNGKRKLLCQQCLLL